MAKDRADTPGDDAPQFAVPRTHRGSDGEYLASAANPQGGGTISPTFPAASIPATLGSAAETSASEVPTQNTLPAKLIYEIEAGMRAPGALLPHGKPMSPQVAGALESIRLDFDREISAAADPAAVWDQARERGDNAFRTMFGFESFNQPSM